MNNSIKQQKQKGTYKRNRHIQRLIKRGVPQVVLAKRYGVTRQRINQIKKLPSESFWSKLWPRKTK